MKNQVAGDADRDGVAERRSLADREAGNLGEDSVHRQTSPGMVFVIVTNVDAL